MGDVTNIYPDGCAVNPDNVLEQAVGAYENVVIMGFDKEGGFDLRASTNLSKTEVIWIIEQSFDSMHCSVDCFRWLKFRNILNGVAYYDYSDD